MTHKITVIKNHLSTRESAKEIFSKINKIKDYKIQVDFSLVKTMTRSFMHELLLLKEKSMKEIDFINLDKELNKYMKYVKIRNGEDYFHDITHWKIEEV